ncbi:mechanosensitive ion channel family protein [Halodesulfovibrio marinisediminis]|uniref:Small conductance mechanosensitive channel n=1 Tax=Halodesulfovibrio marinisediminis DSM 17456 TaxID=1121457 RepID=A0A1N6F454_9BACT|nr:mechanosensitive ion channel domain-containing protein [Halodesulfovibrio marinisediminis]SIN90029.1 small conductance mechanosensitive channel [Halodesulfovibrio marinisediminis DSM 17456]
MFDFQTLSSMISVWLLDSGINILYALFILILGWWLARHLTRLIRIFLDKNKIDPLQTGFITTIVRYSIIIAVLLIAASRVGINITSLIAIFGAAALAIGLAVKDNLSNFSSGMLLVFFRPFTKGDFVEVCGTMGTIEATSLFSTVLTTVDNKKVFIPNSMVMNNVITNYSANPTRRLDLTIGIDYGANITEAKKILLDVLEKHTAVRTTPEPVVAVEALADSSVNITMRAWVPTEQYLSTKFELLEECKNALTEQGVSIPFPQMDIHMDK